MKLLSDQQKELIIFKINFYLPFCTEVFNINMHFCVSYVSFFEKVTF